MVTAIITVTQQRTTKALSEDFTITLFVPSNESSFTHLSPVMKVCTSYCYLLASFRSVRAKLKSLSSIITAWLSGRAWPSISTSSRTVVISLLKSLIVCFPGRILMPLKRKRMK